MRKERWWLGYGGVYVAFQDALCSVSLGYHALSYWDINKSLALAHLVLVKFS